MGLKISPRRASRRGAAEVVADEVRVVAELRSLLQPRGDRVVEDPEQCVRGALPGLLLGFEVQTGGLESREKHVGRLQGSREGDDIARRVASGERRRNAPRASAAMSSAHSQTGRASPASAASPANAASPGALGLKAARSIASAASTVRPRSAAAKASSVSGDAWATARRATDHEISDERTAARSCGSPASASQTRAHPRTAWAVTPSRSRA